MLLANQKKLKAIIGPLSILLTIGTSSVNALPLNDSSWLENLKKVGNGNIPVLSQASDVIIDFPTGSSNPDTNVPSTTIPTSTNSDTRFRCQNVNGEYTVMYFPESEPNRGYAWAIPSSMGGGWTPERRCNEISRRLEMYRPDGLVELGNAVENNYNTICATTEKDPNCRIVLTVPRGQDPELTRDAIFQNLVVADSGQGTQGVYTFTSKNRNGSLLTEIDKIVGSVSSTNKVTKRSKSKTISLKPFLDRADRGTGTKLSNNANNNKKPSLFRQLNPNKFR
jgi:hypothetical protein